MHDSIRTRLRSVGLGTAGVLAWLAVWQWCTTRGPLAHTGGFANATDTLRNAVSLAGESWFRAAVGQTLFVAVCGLLLAVAVGVALGVAMGLSPIAFRALDPTSQFLRAVPPVVVLPLFLLLLGPSFELGVALAAVTALWPILVQTLVGVRSTDVVLLDNARAMRLSWIATQLRVVLPSALPNIATGVRIAASGALLLAIGVGLLAGAPGIGRSILVAQQSGDEVLVFAIIIWSGALGLVVSVALSALERHLTRRHPVTEEGR